MTGSGMANGTLRVLVVCGQASVSREDAGGSKRQWHLINALARNGIASTVWSVEPGNTRSQRLTDEDEIRSSRRLTGRARRTWVDKLAALMSPMPDEVWMRPVPAGASMSALEEHDVVLLMGPGPAQILPWARAANKPVVIDMHDIPHVLIGRIAAALPSRTTRWRTRIDASKWARFERRVTAQSSLVTAVSEADADAFRAMSPTNVVVRPNGVDVATYRFVDHRRPGSGRLLMTGDFAYPPNIDAAHWLTERILPRLRAERPGLTLSLVGRHAPKGSWPDGVIAAADVPQIQGWFDGADIFIVPLRAGGGTRIKIIEALAKGLPCIATSIGCEGLPVEDGVHLLIADSTDELVSATLRLLDDSDLRATLAVNGRRLVEQQFDWAAIGDAFAADVTHLAAGSLTVQ